MTTDTVAKQVVVDGQRLVGRRHGQGRRDAGPQLATMLVVLTTDAVVDAGDLDPRCAPRPGSASTGSTPTAACPPTTPCRCWPAAPAGSRRPTRTSTEALTAACTDLAMQLLADAEGADHEIAITVLHAATEDEAVEVGRAVARSNLFKAAVFGNDPNWGRVLATIGTTRGGLRPGRPRRRDERRLGLPQSARPARTRPASTWSRREVHVTVDLKAGDARATVWTNDLTHAYVHENSRVLQLTIGRRTPDTDRRPRRLAATPAQGRRPSPPRCRG